MSELISVLNGVNGQLELYIDKVIIKRKGVVAKITQGFFKGDKTIYLKQITGIQIKPGGILLNGYIQFTLPGGIENKKGIVDATKDENTVIFTKKYNEEVSIIKTKIEEYQSLTPTAQQINQLSSADEIRKYKTLFDDGLITEDEFNTKRNQLLNF